MFQCEIIISNKSNLPIGCDHGRLLVNIFALFAKIRNSEPYASFEVAFTGATITYPLVVLAHWWYRFSTCPAYLLFTLTTSNSKLVLCYMHGRRYAIFCIWCDTTAAIQPILPVLFFQFLSKTTLLFQLYLYTVQSYIL